MACSPSRLHAHLGAAAGAEAAEGPVHGGGARAQERHVARSRDGGLPGPVGRHGIELLRSSLAKWSVAALGFD